MQSHTCANYKVHFGEPSSPEAGLVGEGSAPTHHQDKKILFETKVLKNFDQGIGAPPQTGRQTERQRQMADEQIN